MPKWLNVDVPHKDLNLIWCDLLKHEGVQLEHGALLEDPTGGLGGEFNFRLNLDSSQEVNSAKLKTGCNCLAGWYRKDIFLLRDF